VVKMNRDMERILFLRSVPIFSDVDGSDLQWINEIAHERKVRAGYVVFRENDIGDAMYIVLKGRVRVLKGSNLVLQIMEDKDCFGEMSILDREPRSATVETVVETTLLAIKRDDFQRLLLARPQIAFALFKTISRRLREATERLSARS
jgi:CRP-like cAMP-binding protein